MNSYQNWQGWGHRSGSTLQGSISTMMVPWSLLCVTPYSQASGLITSENVPREKFHLTYFAFLSYFVSGCASWLKPVSVTSLNFTSSFGPLLEESEGNNQTLLLNSPDHFSLTFKYRYRLYLNTAIFLYIPTSLTSSLLKKKQIVQTMQCNKGRNLFLLKIISKIIWFQAIYCWFRKRLHN